MEMNQASSPRVCGIIAEYNPLHNGHAEHIRLAKEKTNSDYVVAVMSGDFTQRGEPAIADPWSRARMALAAGVDIVFELPECYAVQPAEWFAFGGVLLLHSLGVVSHIAFGAENPDVDMLSRIDDAICPEPAALSQAIRDDLSKGHAHPRAREHSVIALRNELKLPYSDEDIHAVLSSSNNILAMHYLRAIKTLQSSLCPVAIQRLGGRYLAENLEESRFNSATAIRKEMIENGRIPIESLPSSTFSILQSLQANGQRFIGLDNLSDLVLYRLRIASADQLAQLPDMREGLEALLWKKAQYTSTLSELVDATLSKRYTRARLQRFLIHALLGITQQNIDMLRETRPMAARVFGMRQRAFPLMRQIHEKASLPVVTRPGRFHPADAPTHFLWQTNLLASDIIALTSDKNELRKGRRCLTEPMVVVE